MLHHFAKDPHSIIPFDSTSTFSQFKRKIEKISKELPVQDSLHYNNHVNMKENIDVLRGKYFEVFCELFTIHFGYSPNVGFINYTPVPREEDRGVDAYGFNLAGEKAAIQCKYRGDPSDRLNSEYIATFANSAYIHGSIDYRTLSSPNIKKLFLFTSSMGMYDFTRDEMFNGLIKEINGQLIEAYVDGNLAFWQDCLCILQRG